MLLYRRWVLCGRRRTFGFPNGDLKKLGIDRHAKRKALAGLEQAGLIAVEYLPGHAILVIRRWRYGCVRSLRGGWYERTHHVVPCDPTRTTLSTLVLLSIYLKSLSPSEKFGFMTSHLQQGPLS